MKLDRKSFEWYTKTIARNYMPIGIRQDGETLLFNSGKGVKRGSIVYDGKWHLNLATEQVFENRIDLRKYLYFIL